MGTFRIFTRRGRRFVRLERGRMYCLLMRSHMRKQTRYYGKRADGLYKASPREFGWDPCDRVI
jgi:hypothetical protein